MKTKLIHPRMKKHFHMFARNGRWGTCGGCPEDGDGNTMPELCTDTLRYDHNLTIESLVEQHNIWLKEYIEKGLPS